MSQSEIALIPVSIHEKPALRRMMHEYQREMFGAEAGDYKHLDSYWEKIDRFPYFIEFDGKPVGFVLINSYTILEKNAKTISELYVVKDYRAKGIGKETAFKSFALFPGKWEIRELKTNTQARKFWNKVIGEFTKNNYTEKEVDNDLWSGPIQLFET